MQDFLVITLKPSSNILLQPEKPAFRNTKNIVSNYLYLKTDQFSYKEETKGLTFHTVSYTLGSINIWFQRLFPLIHLYLMRYNLMWYNINLVHLQVIMRIEWNNSTVAKIRLSIYDIFHKLAFDNLLDSHCVALMTYLSYYMLEKWVEKAYK